MFLFSSHGSSLGPDSVLVIGLVLAEALEGLGLGRIINVGIIEEVLDPQKDLLDGYGRPPVFLLVQDRETN